MSSWTRRIVAALTGCALFSLASCTSQRYFKEIDELPTKPGRATFESPSGDPIRSPIRNKNEFVFSGDDSGRLSMELKAIWHDGPAVGEPTDNLRFTIEDLRGLVPQWGALNIDGKAHFDSKTNTATATVEFIGLPERYDAFGRKTVTLWNGSEPLGSQSFEVFYMGWKTNHPPTVQPAICEPPKIDSRIKAPRVVPRWRGSTPNWFYYYRQNALAQKLGCGLYGYACHDPASTEKEYMDPANNQKNEGRSLGYNGEGEASIGICDEAYEQGDSHILTDLMQGQLTAIGISEPVRYYASFVGILMHELEHANQNAPNDTQIDLDSDGIADKRELNVTHTNPRKTQSAIEKAPTPVYEKLRNEPDNEIYAGGPVEQWGVMHADTSNDWACPGTNCGSYERQ